MARLSPFILHTQVLLKQIMKVFMQTFQASACEIVAFEIAGQVSISVGAIPRDKERFAIRRELRRGKLAVGQLRLWVRRLSLADHEEALLRELMQLAANLIAGHRTWKNDKGNATALARLVGIAVELAQFERLAELVEQTCVVAAKYGGARQASVLVTDARGEVLLSATGDATGRHSTASRSGLGESMVPGAMRPSMIGNAPALQLRHVPARRGAKSKRARIHETSLLSLPMIFQDEVCGFLNLYYPEPRKITREESDALDLLASFCAAQISSALVREKASVVSNLWRQADTEARVLVESQRLSSGIGDSLSAVSVIAGAMVARTHASSGSQIGKIRETLMNVQPVLRSFFGIGHERIVPDQLLDPAEVLGELVSVLQSANVFQDVWIENRVKGPMPAVACRAAELYGFFINCILSALGGTSRGGGVIIDAAAKPDHLRIFSTSRRSGEASAGRPKDEWRIEAAQILAKRNGWQLKVRGNRLGAFAAELDLSNRESPIR